VLEENQEKFNLVQADESIDEILNGRMRIIQKKNGYRFSLDSILLSHFAQVGEGESVLDLGTGSGIIPMVLSYRARPQRIFGLEIQDEMADMARRSVRLNNLQDLIEIGKGDVKDIKTRFQPGTWDVVVCNPPYRKPDSGKLNPDLQKAIARHELKGKLSDFISAASYLLRRKGRCYLIYKVRRMAALFSSLQANGIEPKRMRLVHSKRESEGEFVLLEGCKSGGEELHVLPPLIIYNEDGTYTEEMKVIFAETASGHS
jgi:tRNA1Val (adenine37-N6)-methyltransferase